MLLMSLSSGNGDFALKIDADSWSCDQATRVDVCQIDLNVAWQFLRVLACSEVKVAGAE